MTNNQWWGDVMSTVPQQEINKKPWFSNPNLTYLGTPRGSHAKANCTRVHSERRHAVASFRTPMQYPMLWDMTVGARQYADIVGSENVFIFHNVTFAAGSEGSIRAGSTIQLFGGLKVEAGATLSLRVEGPGSLSKQAFDNLDHSAHEVAEAAIPGNVSLQVVPGSDGVALHYGLPEGTRVSYRVLTLRGQVVASRNLGSRTAGRHVEMLRLDAGHGSIYFVELRAGNTVRTERFALVR